MFQEIREMNSEFIDWEQSVIHVVVISDFELIREGLTLLISGKAGLKVAGEAGCTADGIELVGKVRPDVILFNVEVQNCDALEYIPEFLAVSGGSRVLVLSTVNDPEIQRRALLLGAVGALSKNCAADMLIKAIEKIHAGEAWVDRSITASVLAEFSLNKNRPDPEELNVASLTGREREVIKLVGEGLKNKLIAQRLFISTVTVQHHLSSIYSKLDVSDRLELAVYAYRNNLAEIPHRKARA